MSSASDFFQSPAGIFIIFMAAMFGLMVCFFVLIFCCVWANEGLEGVQRMIRRRRWNREQRKQRKQRQRDQNRLLKPRPVPKPQTPVVQQIARPSRVVLPTPSVRDLPGRYAHSHVTNSSSSTFSTTLQRTRDWATRTGHVQTLFRRSLEALTESSDAGSSPPSYQHSVRDMV